MFTNDARLNEESADTVLRKNVNNVLKSNAHPHDPCETMASSLDR